MLDNFKILSKNLKLLTEARMFQILSDSAKKYEAELIDLNTSQLEEGLQSNGKRTTPYSSKYYLDLKKSLGSKSGKYADYKLEGDFYEGFFVEFKDNGQIIFDSKDEKTNKLESRDDNIFGIAPKNRSQIAELIRDDFLTEFNKIMFNGF